MLKQNTLFDVDERWVQAIMQIAAVICETELSKSTCAALTGGGLVDIGRSRWISEEVWLLGA